MKAVKTAPTGPKSNVIASEIAGGQSFAIRWFMNCGRSYHSENLEMGQLMNGKVFETGQWVRNPRRPDWGVGEIVGVEHDAVRVVFESGERKISTRVVELEMVEPPIRQNHTLGLVVSAPTENLKSLCIPFH